MKSNQFFNTLFTLATLTQALALPMGAVSHAVNAGHTETANFQDVRAIIDAAVSTTTPDHVLVVFDLDNTTLATQYDLGSEHWFLWQSELIKANVQGAVASSIDDLLAIQGWIYTLTKASAVEPRIPVDVAALGAQGVRFMALTSRSLDVRDVTLRELVRNGLDFTEFAPGPKGGFGGAYKPYDLQHLEAAGLTEADAAQFKLQAPKDVIFERGVMLTQGMHKGVMLKTLLAKTSSQFDAIVFVDDRAHHSEGMQAAFENRPERVSTVRYTHELPRIEAFRTSDKQEAIAQWCQLSQGLRVVNSLPQSCLP